VKSYSEYYILLNPVMIATAIESSGPRGNAISTLAPRIQHHFKYCLIRPPVFTTPQPSIYLPQYTNSRITPLTTRHLHPAPLHPTPTCCSGFRKGHPHHHDSPQTPEPPSQDSGSPLHITATNLIVRPRKPWRRRRRSTRPGSQQGDRAGFKPVLQ
jgi:hypothetical protein